MAYRVMSICLIVAITSNTVMNFLIILAQNSMKQLD